jgi:hypothetical protein
MMRWTPSQNTASRMHLTNGRSARNYAYAWKGITSRVIVASRPKINFLPDGSTSPGFYGYTHRISWHLRPSERCTS